MNNLVVQLHLVCRRPCTCDSDSSRCPIPLQHCSLEILCLDDSGNSDRGEPRLQSSDINRDSHSDNSRGGAETFFREELADTGLETGSHLTEHFMILPEILSGLSIGLTLLHG